MSPLEVKDLASHLAIETAELINRHLSIAATLSPTSTQVAQIVSGAVQGSAAYYACKAREADPSMSSSSIANAAAMVVYSQVQQALVSMGSKR